MCVCVCVRARARACVCMYTHNAHTAGDAGVRDDDTESLLPLCARADDGTGPPVSLPVCTHTHTCLYTHTYIHVVYAYVQCSGTGHTYV